MTKRNIILKILKFDEKYIRDLITTNGGIGAVRILRECYTDGPLTPRISNGLVRMMIWNILVSLDELEEITNSTYSCSTSIEHLASITEDKSTHTIAHHIIGGIEVLKLHVAV